MSRRRSRVAPSPDYNGSDGRELTVDEFLRVLAKVPRAPRVLRASKKRSQYISDAAAGKASKASLTTSGLTDRHEREATFLLETLAAIEGNEGHSERPNPKTKKTIQAIDTDDIEWNNLIGGVEIAQKKRKKHYVVCNSLPLSRDTDFNDSQPSNEKTPPSVLHDDPVLNTRGGNNDRRRDKYVLGACVHDNKALIPISTLRGMIETPKLARKASPDRVVKGELSPNRELALRLRNKPGSGFDSPKQIDSSERGVLNMAVRLPSVPETLYGQPSTQVSEVETLNSQPPLFFVQSTFPAENYAANDHTAYHEESWITRHGIIHRESEVAGPALIERMIKQSNSAHCSSAPTSKRPKADYHIRPRDFAPSNSTIENLENTYHIITKHNGTGRFTPRCTQSGPIIELQEYFNDYNNEKSKISRQDIPMSSGLDCIGAQTEAEGLDQEMPKEKSNGAETLCTTKFWKAHAELSHGGSHVLAQQLPIDSSTSPVPNSIGLNRGSSREDPVSKLSDEPLPMLDFGLGRVKSGMRGQSKRRNLPGGGTREETGEEEEGALEEQEPTLQVFRRFFTNRPGRSYFSMAQRVLNSSSGTINCNPLDYLRRPQGGSRFLAVSEAINEKQKISTGEMKGEEEETVVRNTNIGTRCIGRSPMSLKELLNRSGRRRTSISGIFHRKNDVYSAKQPQKVIQYPGSSSREPDSCLIPASSPVSSPIGSKSFSVYASRRASTKVLRPYVSPLQRSMKPKETVELRHPVVKLKRGVTMAAGSEIETDTPVRKKFKPPLLKSRAKTSLQSGGVGTLPKRTWINALEDTTEPGPAGEGQIDMQSISSFRAVQEAW